MLNGISAGQAGDAHAVPFVTSAASPIHHVDNADDSNPTSAVDADWRGGRDEADVLERGIEYGGISVTPRQQPATA